MRFHHRDRARRAKMGAQCPVAHKKYGYSASTNAIMLLCNVSVSLAVLAEKDTYTPFLVRIYAVWYSVNALGFMIIPSIGGNKIWEAGFMFRCVGYTCVQLATLLFLLELGLEPVTAFGYSFAVISIALTIPVLRAKTDNKRKNNTKNRSGLNFSLESCCSERKRLKSRPIGEVTDLLLQGLNCRLLHLVLNTYVTTHD